MSEPRVVRFEADDSRWGREYGELRVWVHFPGYVNGAEHNGRIWDVVDAFIERHPEWRTKDGYLHGHVNGCGPDEILVTRRLK